MEDRISDDSEFWYTVGLIYNQFQGLMEGYNAAADDNHVRTRVSYTQRFNSLTDVAIILGVKTENNDWNE